MHLTPQCVLTQLWQALQDSRGFFVSQGHSSADVILLVQFWNCLFLFLSSARGQCNAPNPPHPGTDTKTVLQSLIHVRCTGALNNKIKPAAHESIKLIYKTGKKKLWGKQYMDVQRTAKKLIFQTNSKLCFSIQENQGDKLFKIQQQDRNN